MTGTADISSYVGSSFFVIIFTWLTVCYYYLVKTKKYDTVARFLGLCAVNLLMPFILIKGYLSFGATPHMAKAIRLITIIATFMAFQSVFGSLFSKIVFDDNYSINPVMLLAPAAIHLIYILIAGGNIIFAVSFGYYVYLALWSAITLWKLKTHIFSKK